MRRTGEPDLHVSFKERPSYDRLRAAMKAASNGCAVLLACLAFVALGSTARAATEFCPAMLIGPENKPNDVNIQYYRLRALTPRSIEGTIVADTDVGRRSIGLSGTGRCRHRRGRTIELRGTHGLLPRGQRHLSLPCRFYAVTGTAGIFAREFQRFQPKDGRTPGRRGCQRQQRRYGQKVERPCHWRPVYGKN